MFLKKLFEYNKILFSFFILFVALFIFINLKKGMVATPVYQFGMYSGKQNLGDTVTSFKIVADDKQVDLSKFSFIEVDQLMNPLSAYFNARENNVEMMKTMNSFFSKTGLSFFQNISLGGYEVGDAQFGSWYKAFLFKKIGLKVQQLKIYRQRLTWNKGLQPVSSPIQIF